METNMLCAYCNNPRTGKMEIEFYTTACGNGTCEGTGIYIDIYCENCNKLLYRKETDNIYNG